MKYVLILWLSYDATETSPATISVTSHEFDDLSAAAAAGYKVLEKAPLTETGTPHVRWVVVPKATEEE